MKSFRRSCIAGIAMAEVMVAIGLFGITAAAAVAALIRINTNASLCRLQTGACTVAQNQIDLILSDGPFNPQLNQIPPELKVGETDQGSSDAPTIAVYTDPSTNQKVLGWMQTVIQDTGATSGGTQVYVYQATVTVFYKYKGRQYSVSLNTMRASDT